MKFLVVRDSLVLFLLLSEEVVLAFSVVRLWSLSLLFLQFTLLEQTKTVLPTNAAAAFQGQASGCWRKSRQPERSRGAVRTERKRAAGRGEKKKEEKWGDERKGEEHAVSPTPEVSGSPLLSVPYLQKALFRDSPNEHSCPHSAPQWSPPQPLSLLTMENIAPIKPQRQWAGVGEGVEVCV